MNFQEALYMADKFTIRAGETLEGYCRQILDKLDSRFFTAEDFFAIHLSLQEAFINAIKHGNKQDPAKLVHVDFNVTSDKCEVFIADEGAGFDPACLPDPTSNENLLKTSGRGILLIRSYMDFVEFNETGNVLHMIKYSSCKL